MVKIENIKKYYEGRLVLDVPRLYIEKGERYAIIGANGSGKSTLIKIIAGALEPDEGTVEFEDILIGETAYMPQTPYPFDLTVLKNVMLSLGSGESAREKAIKAIERVGLATLADARGNQLSGGETQRMALAGMIAKPRKMLILDEPTSATDIQANNQIEKVLLDYASENEATLIISSHAPSQAMRLSTKVIVLDNGRICEMGETEKILSNPTSESARMFLQHWKI